MIQEQSTICLMFADDIVLSDDTPDMLQAQLNSPIIFVPEQSESQYYQTKVRKDRRLSDKKDFETLSVLTCKCIVGEWKEVLIWYPNVYSTCTGEDSMSISVSCWKMGC